jgi:hypothetical protein
LFPLITVVLCFLHGFLKIRDRCRKASELHRRVWDVYRAATAEEFRRLMNEFQQWCATQTWTTSVREMLTKLWNKTESYVVAYDHPGCHRTSNAVDRPMNPAVPADVCKPGLARPSKHVRVTAAGLGLTAELSPLCPAEQPTPYPRQSRSSTQQQTLP